MDKKPSKKDVQAVSNLVANAEAAVKLAWVHGRMAKLADKDLPTIASLFDLLNEHPKIANDAGLLGAVSAIQSVFIRAWDDIESMCEDQ
jgi:hypothetical protein